MDDRFELSKLLDYSTESILNEIKRVASLTTDKGILTLKLFDNHSKVSSSTVIKKFGSWKTALELAGMENRHSGSIVTESMKQRTGLRHTKENVIDELNRVAKILGSGTFTATEFSSVSSLINPSSITRKFGSWAEAMHSADLVPSKRSIRYTEEDYLENILIVWIHFGRQPKYSEMNDFPSKISAGAYEAKFGKWTDALRVFVERANGEEGVSFKEETLQVLPQIIDIKISDSQMKAIGRTTPIGLRYRVLKRDNFKCVLCGSSPATSIDCKLHVDHIVPWSKGGKTEESNLRALCENCNVGRGNKD